MVAHFLLSGMEAARHAVEVQLFRFARNDICLSKKVGSAEFLNGVQWIPVGAAARPAERRGPRPAPPRAVAGP